MGGRGGKSGMTGARSQNGTQVNSSTSTTAPNPNTVSQQAPNTSNTPVNPNILSDLQKMDDTQLAALVNSSKGVDMPNMLSDIRNQTQEFVYTIGLNEKPEVLDDAAFDQYMKDNNIPTSQQLARSVNPITYRNKSNTTIHMTEDDVSDMLKYSRLNYIGGKHGGNLYGNGTYFDMNGGYNTGYGRQTIRAVLNPKKAKVIDSSSLRQQGQAFMQSHPKFRSAVGVMNRQNEAIYALAMGYNVIQAGSYNNVIDRSALVIRKNDV